MLTEKSIYNIFLKILFSLIFLWLCWQLRNLLVILFIVLIVSAALRPLVEKLEEYKIPRGVSALGLLLILAISLFFTIQTLISNVTSDFPSLADQLETNYNSIVNNYQLDQYINSDFGNRLIEDSTNFLRDGIFDLSSNLVSAGLGFFGNVLTLVTIITLVFYLIYEPDKIKNFLFSFLGEKNREKAIELSERAEEKVGFWLLGQLILMLTMGVVSYVGFRLINVEFALPLAIIVGLLDIIPIIGPIIAFVPVMIITLVTNPIQALIVFIFYLIIQQVEGNILVPRIMSKSVGLDPVAVILSLMAGSQLGGVTGAILSVPVAAILMVLYQELMKSKNKVRTRLEEPLHKIDGQIQPPKKLELKINDNLD